MSEELSHPPLKPPLQNSSAPRDKEPKEIEKLLKWQQQRIERRLRGEYESAVMHLQETVNNNLKTPVNIASVRVEGAHGTRTSFLGSIIDPILAASNKDSPEGQSDLESVLHTTRKIGAVLTKSDLFSTVEAKIERAKNSSAANTDVDIIFKTKERGRWYLSSATELGNNEGSASASARVRNVFGGAETFTANLSLGTKTRRSFTASLSAPLTPDLNTFGEFSVYGLERDQTSYASCFEGLRGLKAVVKGGTLEKGLHEMGYEAVHRHVRDLLPTASISMRQAAGESIKSSIFHSYTLDTRNDRIAATRGGYVKFYHEFSGLGGDASFYKTEAEGQVSRPLIPGLSFSLAGRTGLLWGLNKPLLFSDRFQLGGPTSVRSFKANGLGPHDGQDSIGGDIYYSVGASLIGDIPNKAHWPLKGHLWVNAGRLEQVDRARPLTDNVKDMLARPSISAGLGLIYRFDPVRVEVNLGVPLVASKSDGTRKGIQVGVGLEFL
ncbi:mitochondrial protein [Coprinopsis cinerea okayama7|uniref:Mitochondrial protein n=1 Tax=Coprinopsis cinerea (strain Okayama-7 / 130 / ATCC MYA-4618 / FGSC 9003) TaxID=240176 RepID=A8PCJ6_COPC7|nr:mitochondrial protein [Coprinopsis cinerea okayama7\|eukprot:XP_001840415.1 mitochondrial protein [Coprinopsis cinerea okayama7\